MAEIAPLAGGRLGPLASSCKVGRGVLTDGLVAYWKLDEESGLRADSAYAHHANPNGDVTRSTGKIGYGVALGSTAFLGVDDAAELRFSSTMTFRCWTYWSGTGAAPTNRTLASKWFYTGNGGWAFQTHPSTAGELTVYLATSAGDDGSGCRVYTSGAAMTLGTWHHLVMVFDGSLSGNANRLKLYLNGSQLTTVQSLGNVPSLLLGASGMSLYLGNFHSLNRYHQGSLDEVLLSSRAWSASEVTDDYNGGAGRTY